MPYKSAALLKSENREMAIKNIPKQKNQFYQIIRGMCILMVMLIHCPSGLSYGVGTFEFTTQMIIR